LQALLETIALEKQQQELRECNASLVQKIARGPNKVLQDIHINGKAHSAHLLVRGALEASAAEHNLAEPLRPGNKPAVKQSIALSLNKHACMPATCLA
jgi:hypothetical protein